MINLRILKITPLSPFRKCPFYLYLDSTLSKLSNDTKITQNGVQMKKLRSKETRSAEIWEAAKIPAKIRKLRNFAGLVKICRLRFSQRHNFIL